MITIVFLASVAFAAPKVPPNVNASEPGGGGYGVLHLSPSTADSSPDTRTNRRHGPAVDDVPICGERLLWPEDA